MKYLGSITDPKDIVTKEYVDSHGGGGLTIDDIYPIGSIYMSVNSTDPGTLFAGTYWTRIKDTFLLASGDTYAADDGTHTTATGGEATHTLTANESGLKGHGHEFTRPTVTSSGTCNITSSGGHTHTVSSKYRSLKVGTSTSYNFWHNDGSSSGNISPGISADTGKHTHTVPNHTHTLSGGSVTDASGSDAASAHNNMPPYLPIYMWKRVAPPN